MTKRVLVLALSFSLVTSLSVFGAKKPKDEKMLQMMERTEKTNYADENIVSNYLTTPQPKILFPATGDTAGFTYYDMQDVHSQFRMIANGPDGTVHFTWINLVGPSMFNSRYFDYNSWDRVRGWLVAGGIHATPAVARSGYGGLDLLPDNREVLCYHRIQPEPQQWGTAVSIEDSLAGLGQFSSYDISDSCEGSSKKSYWPTVSTSKLMNGDTSYIHITHAESYRVDLEGEDRDLGYVRCFEKPGVSDTLVCMSPGWEFPLLIPKDTRLVPNKIPYSFATARLTGAIIATSPVSQKVAIVYLQNTAPSQTQNELMYYESLNNGQDWMDDGNMGTPVQITDYAAGGYVDRAYCDLAVVYDYNDNLHIIWTTYKSTDANDVTLWHWTPVQGISKAGFATASSAVNPGEYNLLISKFNLGVEYMPTDTAYNYLYVNYTKFRDGDISADGFANGDIYIKASSNGGLTWGPAVNLTNTNSDGCTAENCFSEHWSSLAERVDSFLYVQYIEDKDAGSVHVDEGTYTNNPVRYLKYPRPLVPEVPSIAYSPASMIEPIRWALNNTTTQESLVVDNYGTATLYVQIIGPSWVNIIPSSFNIPEAGPAQTVNLTLSGIGLQDTFLVDSLLIATNNGLLGGAESYVDTEWVKINFVVTDNFFYAEYDTIENIDMIATVSNVGNLGNPDQISGLSYNGYNYLYDCSPVILTNIDGYGWKGASWIHTRNDFLPLSPLQVTQDECSGDIVIISTSRFAPINPTLPAPYQWFWWWYAIEEKNIFFSQPAELRKVIVKTTKLIKNPPPPWWCHIEPEPTNLPSVYFGLAADWDVPTEAWGKNIGGYDDILNLIWLQADSAGFENYYGAFLFFYAAKDGDTSWSPLGAHVLNNATQLWPFVGFDDDSLYKYMSTPGWSIESDSAQDMNILISAIYLDNPDTATEVTVKYALIVTDQGLSDLYDIANQLKQNRCGDISDTLTYTAYSPVDLIVIDPLQDSIGVDFNTIPGASYDTTQDINNDGDLDDRVVIPNPVVGDYTIKVVAEPGADTGHYSLHVKLDGNEEEPLVLNATVPGPGEVDTVFYTASEYLRGDPNRDGSPSVSDVIFLINYLFKGGEAPDPLFLGDVNCDESLSVADVVYMVNYLFKGGTAPCS